MKMNKKISLFLLLALASVRSFGQGKKDFLNDTFFQNGKYYVVVAILVIIFLGISIFVALLDRKITRLEKEVKEKEIK